MSEKILIVDDDVESLKLIGLMLKRQGYEVTVADSGNKALSKVEAEPPNLIILDVMMPDMSGLDVCRHLRQNPMTSSIPIIMFTAKTLIDDKVKGFEAGADDYLTKPTHPAELANRIKTVIQRKATETQSTNAVDAQAQSEGKPSTQAKIGKLIGVLGVKGGVGTTTVAINVGAALIKNGKKPVLADLRLGVGSMGLMLGQDADGMIKLVKEDSITPATVNNALITHKSGLRALVSSANPHDAALEFDVDKPINIIQALRRVGDPTIVDLGYGLNRYSAELLGQVEQLLYVIEANNTTLEMAKQQLRVLKDLVSKGFIHVVVVNRSQTTLPWHEAENRLNREVKAIISPAPELAFQSGEQATPMVMLQPTAMVSGQFVKLANELN